MLDRLTEALPVWSPDSLKVAAAFETDAMIYGAATKQPTQGRIKLAEPLLAASRLYDVEESGSSQSRENSGNANANSTEIIPASFNPIVRLEWSTPEKLYLKTAFVRLIKRSHYHFPTLASVNAQSSGSNSEIV